MDYICYINGEFLPRDEVSIPIDDLGFTRGYAVYEALRTYGDTPFYLEAHMERLRAAAKLLELPDLVDEIPQIIFTLIRLNPSNDLFFRIFLTGTPTLVVLAEPHPVLSKKDYTDGIFVITTPLSRYIPQIKSTSYISAMLALKEAERRGAYDALYVDKDRNLLEMTKANFFALIGNRLLTAGESVLHGVTRQVVLEIADEANLKAEVGPIPYDLIPTFDGAFLTSTTRELLPITKIDGFSVPRSKKIDTLLRIFQSKTHPKEIVTL